jgi:hypothetical protein
LESNSVQSYFQALEKQCTPDKVSRIKRKASRQEFTSVTPLSTVYVPKKNHYFRKIVPFQQVQNQISSLEYALTELDPSTTSPHFEQVSGQFSNFFKTKLTRTPSQNSVKCAEADGAITSWKTLTASKIQLTASTVVSDTFSIRNNEINCNIYGILRVDQNCIQAIFQLAESQSLFFSNKTVAQTQTDLIKRYPNQMLYIVLNSTHVTLDPLPRTIAYCKISNIPGQSNKPDELTSVIKTKFYHHLVSIDSNILEALSRKHLALQRSYFLLLDSQLPGPGPVKPFDDLCAAAKKLLPRKAAITLATPMDDFQAFLEPTLPNSVLGTQAFAELETLLITLCSKDKNRPIIMQILHGLQAMNLNIQAHFVSFAKHKQSSHKMALPSPFPLLFSSQSTAADVHQSYYNILRTDLAIEDLKFLYIVTENEKTYMLQWVRDLFHRITVIPIAIPIHTMNQDQIQPKSTIYNNHVELK